MRKIKLLHQKAVTLCEGGVVEVNGLSVRAKRVPDYCDACQHCEMDSACDMQMNLLCDECDKYDMHKHILYFNKPRYKDRFIK